MAWRPLANGRDKAAFALFVLGGPLDLAYEVCVVTGYYHQQGFPTNYFYYGMTTCCLVAF